MIDIKPIEAPFSAPIVSVEVSIADYKLDADEPTISVKLFDKRGELYKEITQLIPADVHNQWGTDNDFIINWALKQNNIEKL